MKLLFGPKRRKALSQTFLNIFTLLVPSAIASEFFAKFPIASRIAIWCFVVVVLLLGWLMTTENLGEPQRLSLHLQRPGFILACSFTSQTVPTSDPLGWHHAPRNQRVPRAPVAATPLS